MNILEINDLKFGYNNTPVLDGVDLKLHKGDFLAISGGNGSGKSTLIKLILGELKKDSGEIKILGENIENFNKYDRIGYVPQNNDSWDIAFPITCKEYVVLNLYDEFSFFNRPTKDCYKKVENIFSMLNINDLLERQFNSLSGGQKQRVMIARALVKSPEILILDEPTVGIDSRNKADFLDLLHHLNDFHKITILIISHEMELLDSFVTKTVHLKEGRIYV